MARFRDRWQSTFGGYQAPVAPDTPYTNVDGTPLGSPYDETTRQLAQSTPDTEAQSRISDPIDRDETFYNIEAYFHPSYEHKVDYFDTTLTDYRALQTVEFTSDDLAAIDDDNPAVQRLREARQRYDEHTLSFKQRLLMDGTERRARARKRQAAKEAFDTARQDYIDSLAPPEQEVTPLARLTLARVELAEAGFQARSGGLFGNRKARKQLAGAQKRYDTARDEYFTETYARYTSGMSLDEKIQFSLSFKDHEQGALAGEEANLFLTATNDQGKKSRFQKLTERYNALSTPKKIATGLGIAAIASVGFGAIGGGMAVGGVIGAKFGRNYFTGEARRRAELSDKRTQQEQSVLYAGSYDDSEADYELLSTAANRVDTLAALNDAAADKHRAAIEQKSAQETRERRKVLGKAAVISAIPFIGGTIAGVITEHGVSFASHGLLRGGHVFGHHDTATPPSGHSPETPAPAPQAPDAPDIAPDTPPAISPESSYLYGTDAGQQLDITISRPGSSIWQEVSDRLAAAQPGLPSVEHERITANIVNKIVIQHPGLDPNTLPVGTSISTPLPR